MSTECEICGEEVNRVYECEVCGVLFCRDCGSTSEKICNECSEEQSEEDEDWSNDN